MQVAIELPDELGKQLLEMPDMQSLIQKAIEKMLLEEHQKRSPQLLVDVVKDLPEFSMFKDRDPSELQRVLRDKSILPITRSLVGILEGSNVDISDYKKHLEEKYL